MMSPTDSLVPIYRNMLNALSGWLDRAEGQGEDMAALLAGRLAPDMLPLSSQIAFACYQAHEVSYRLTDEPLPAAVQEVARIGRTAGEGPGSIADARAWIGDALARLDGLAPDALDGGATRAVALELPNGMVFDMTGEQYVRDWALAQFHFHLVTAYAILRSRGIGLGKADYVAHMFAYLRPGTMPAG